MSQDGAEEQELLSGYELQKSLGLDIEWLSAWEARDIEPGALTQYHGCHSSVLRRQVEPRNVVRGRLREAFLVSGRQAERAHAGEGRGDKRRACPWSEDRRLHRRVGEGLCPRSRSVVRAD